MQIIAIYFFAKDWLPDGLAAEHNLLRFAFSLKSKDLLVRRKSCILYSSLSLFRQGMEQVGLNTENVFYFAAQLFMNMPVPSRNI
jgi:hypothetical protein